MTQQKSAMRGVPVVLQEDETTGNGLVIAIPSSFREHALYIKGSAGVSAGAVQPETATPNTYTGDWAPLGGGAITVLDDGEVAVNFSGTFIFLRCRISTPIVDGTVTVTYVGS